MDEASLQQIKMIPKRTLLISLAVAIILIVLVQIFAWSLTEILIGFWIGVGVSLISFYLMLNNAKKMLAQVETRMNIFEMFGFFIRLGLYAICFFLMVQIGLQALLAAAVGLSMVSIALKFNNFNDKTMATADDESSEND